MTLEHLQQHFAVGPLDAGRREFAVIGHPVNNKLENVTSEENSPLKIDLGSRELPADTLQALDEADDDKSVDLRKPCGRPESIKVIEKQKNYPLEL